MAEIDLLVTGATIVTPRTLGPANLGVREGKVVFVGPQRPEAARTVAADDLLLLPGGVDTHVHLMDPGSPECEDFPSGTRAAAVAGTTTIIEHTHGAPVRSPADLDAKVDHLTGRSNIDFGLAAHAWPGHSDGVAALWAAGVSYFKVFTCATHGLPGHSPADVFAHLAAAARVGARTLVHCEDESITARAEGLLRKAGRVDPGLLVEWRNLDAELAAVAMVAMAARRTGAEATIAHVSSPEVADYITSERDRGARLTAESCPQYFLLREEEVHRHGALRKFTPPARAHSTLDEAQMWGLLRSGALHHISTDHAPSTLAQKREGDFWDVHFGLPGLDSTYPLLLDAVARGQLTYQDVARVYSENPAKIHGLWPRKGSLLPGADADFVLVDPRATWTLSNDRVFSKAGWTPYDGRQVTGRPVATWLRGVQVAADGVPVDARAGAFLSGPGSRSR